MDENRFDILMLKYLSNTISEKEKKELEKWIFQNEENEKLFKATIKAQAYGIDALHYNQRPFPKRKRGARVAAAIMAAASVVLLGLIFWLNMVKTQDFPHKFATLSVGHTSYRLTPDMSEIKNQQQIIGKLKNGTLEVFDNAAGWITVEVPKGMKLKLKLPDQSNVEINAATTISFSGGFTQNDKRSVNLAGEAYFEVTKNPYKPFVVKTDRFETQVLGTKFNINSYPTDTENSITLLEGSVLVDDLSTREKIKMLPGEKVDFPKTKLAKTKAKVAQPQMAIAWAKDEIIFEDEPLQDILSKIERVYDVKIVNKKQGISEEKFSGRFKKQDLKEILEVFSRQFNCRYTYQDNTVTLYE